MKVGTGTIEFKHKDSGLVYLLKMTAFSLLITGIATLLLLAVTGGA